MDSAWGDQFMSRDGSHRWQRWGAEVTIPVNAVSTLPGDVPVEIVRLVAPSPREMRVMLQAIGNGFGKLTVRIRCGVGSVEMPFDIDLVPGLPPAQHNIEVVARNLSIEAFMSIPVAVPVTLRAIAAPVVPWM